MDAIDRRIRWAKGLAAKDVRLRFWVSAFNGSLQMIVGTSHDGTILWAPEDQIDFIGRDIDELIEWGNCEVEAI